MEIDSKLQEQMQGLEERIREEIRKGDEQCLKALEERNN